MRPLLLIFLFLPFTATAQFFENFETDELGDWVQLPESCWRVSTNDPLSGQSSLKHSFDNTKASSDIIYRPIDFIQPAEGTITWRFMLRHGYNPSGSNKWGVVLFANAPAGEWKSGGAYHAYVIGVNQGSGTDDTLSLYSVRNNSFSNIRKTTVNWEKDITPGGTGVVEVTRSNEGEWTIRVATDGNVDNMEIAARPVLHSTYTEAHYFGLIYAYTTAADMLLWWDDVSVDFVRTEAPKEAEYGDVVFCEIMAKADPSAGLPEVPYIELYNRSGRDLRLEGWKVEYNNTVGNISSAVLPQDSYLILCSSSMVNVMSEFGLTTAVTNISSLTKSGKTLTLRNTKGKIISQLTYSDKWIVDEEKRSGGWSLEKIDITNLSESMRNWSVSIAGNGGTPGERNSVAAINPDVDLPYVVNLQLADTTLSLEFNEVFERENALTTSVYEVNPKIGEPVRVDHDPEQLTKLSLIFDKPFDTGTVYSLIVKEPFCDLAGNIAKDTVYYFAELYTPCRGAIVINEVLFHPFTGGADFVEIVNMSDFIFNAGTLKLANRDKEGAVSSAVGAHKDVYLYPGDHAVFTTRVEALTSFYDVPFPEKVVVLPSLPSYPNSEGCVVLLNAEDEVIDEMIYSEKMHSGFLAQYEGVSLERVNPAVDAAEKSNWQSAAQDAGWATPTFRNSQFNDSHDFNKEGFSLRHAVFSPDGDGYQDILYIDYVLPHPDYESTITIYDIQGRVVNELENSIFLGTSGTLSWDGTLSNGRRVLSGLFILFIKAYDLQGNIKTYKLPFAVAIK